MMFEIFSRKEEFELAQFIIWYSRFNVAWYRNRMQKKSNSV